MLSGMDPLFHFLRFGASEGRKPHPLFDPVYYLNRYADVARSKQNPLVHFLRFGGIEGRCPHPDFDGAFYLRARPDLLAKKMNPLVHFLEQGAAEGCLPNPKFNPKFYMATHVDVAAAKIPALVHFALHGAAEGRVTHGSGITFTPDVYLPVQIPHPRPSPIRHLDVIIPVYKGVEETRACLESVLSSRCKLSFRVIVVNDCSPEPKMTEYLRELRLAQKIILIEHERNLGFVRSANAGMQMSRDDLVLLNSDTLVFDGWLDRLVACAYADDRTGTVTPFSNNATICSYPRFAAVNPIKPSTELAALDSTFAWVNEGRSVEIPTAVGFCMFIRRACLDETGEFDAVTFGLGYGEENDFCMRAAAKQWTHKLACDVFVYHAGQVSFGEASATRQTAMQELVKKHPTYPSVIQAHIQEDPANAYRIAVTAQRIRRSGKRVFMQILHGLGGGVVQHARDLANGTLDRLIWLILKPSSYGRVVLECIAEEHQFSLLLDPQLEYAQLVTLLRACRVERIHIHHLMGYSIDLLHLAEDINAPFDFTVHDYYAICPLITLNDDAGRYCGEPDAEGCNRCLAKRPAGDEISDIASWRAKHAWVLMKADRVITPSRDVAARIIRYYPEIRALAAEHQSSGSAPNPIPKPLLPDEPLRIVVLGAMTGHKGFRLLEECAEHARRSRLPLKFTLVGGTEPELKGEPFPYRETGAYSGDPSAMLDEAAPHLVWFPAQCPETFSYTLSACLERGLPVAAHDMGAFPERLGGRAWSWIIPHTYWSTEWTEFFLRIREHFLTGTGPQPPPELPRALAGFYPDGYLEGSRTCATNGPAILRARTEPIRIAAAVACNETGQIQACGYVRVVQPYTHPAVSDSIQLTVTTPRHLATCDADAVLIQRVAVKDMETAERISVSCRRRGIRLVFEIDDDLFEIPSQHPEYQAYVLATQTAKWLAREADAVVVSTETLRRQMVACNRNTFVLPNYLDDRLWSRPAKKEPALSQPIRFVYIGTNTHRHDLELLGDAVRKLSPQQRQRIQFEVVGVTGDTGSDWFTAISIPRHVSASYPRFVEWIQHRNTWHWAAAPLLDNSFNRSKSPLKFLEYSALGLPSLCSDVETYGEAVRSSGAGLLVANTPEDWGEGLERVLADRPLWTRLQMNCAAVVCENSLTRRAEEIRSLWNILAGREPERNRRGTDGA
jgi:GT2 family glycosyltransferase/glycosyltransferase involved in cell wall biosynthesis